jgi:transcriptional regulator with XRE-family HTH domain
MLVADPETFAEQLKGLREAAGLSQYRLALVSGVSKQTLSQLERGVCDPSWETVRRLARALRVDVTAFDVGELTIPGASDEPEEPPPPLAPAKKPPKKPKR